MEELPDALQQHIIAQIPPLWYSKGPLKFEAHSRLEACLRLEACSKSLAHQVRRTRELWRRITIDSPYITDAELASLLRRVCAKGITTHLDLKFCTGITGQGLQPLAESGVLTEVDISFMPLMSDGKPQARKTPLDTKVIADILSTMIHVIHRLDKLRFSVEDDKGGHLEAALKRLDAVRHVRRGRLPSMRCMTNGVQNLACSHCSVQLPNQKWAHRYYRNGHEDTVPPRGVSFQRPCSMCDKLTCQGGDLARDDDEDCNCPTTIDCCRCARRVCGDCDANWQNEACDACELMYCSECCEIHTCSVCNSTCCGDCRPMMTCEVCYDHFCEECPRDVEQCDSCYRFKCSACYGAPECADCGEQYCSACVLPCRSCDTMFCKSCREKANWEEDAPGAEEVAGAEAAGSYPCGPCCSTCAAA